jgi:hypothetical protein
MSEEEPGATGPGAEPATVSPTGATGPTACVRVDDRYRYFWLKEVTGVDLTQHCARSLRGAWRKDLSFAHDRWRDAGMTEPLVLSVRFEPADAYYFCGVTDPYVWRRNAHLVFVADPNAVEAKVYRNNGLTIETLGLTRVAFSEADINPTDPNRLMAEYRTCRNWQFAHWFAREHGIVSPSQGRSPGGSGQLRLL